MIRPTVLLQFHHLYHVEVVETDGQGQPREEHSTKEQAVLVSGVVRDQVVQVEDADAKYREVGTDAEVGNYSDRQRLCVWEMLIVSLQ